MSSLKKLFARVILSVLVCLLLLSILGANTSIVSAANTNQVNFVVSGGSGSTISPSGLQTYNSGQQVTINATAGSGFSFASWSVSPLGGATIGNASSASTTATINANCTITATFVQATCQVSFSVNGSGSISPSGLQTYNAGQVVTPLIATPSTDFVFVSWSVSPSGAAQIGDNSSTSTFAIIYGSCNITANFNLASYQVNFATIGNGSTSPSGLQSYLPGSQVSVSAVAGSGFSFASWSVSPSGMATFLDAASASTMATINGNCTLTAYFNQISPTPTPATTPTPTPTSTISSTATPTNSSTSTPTPTPTGTVNPTKTPLQSTPTPLSTATPTSSPSHASFLSIVDISLFFAFLAIFLVPTSKLIPRYYQMIPSLVKKLELAALVVSALFLLTAAWQVVTAILS